MGSKQTNSTTPQAATARGRGEAGTVQATPEAATQTPVHIQKWVAAQHDEARRVLRNGPGGQGWRHNETKRKEAEELEAFLANLRRAHEAVS